MVPLFAHYFCRASIVDMLLPWHRPTMLLACQLIKQFTSNQTASFSSQKPTASLPGRLGCSPYKLPILTVTGDWRPP